MHTKVLTWQTVSEDPYYEERSCGDAFPQYMITDLGLSYLVQATAFGYHWVKIGSRTNLLDARAFAQAHFANEPYRASWCLTTGPNAMNIEFPPHKRGPAQIINRIKQARPMETVEVTPSELYTFANARPVLSNADIPDSLRTELPGRVREISPDQLEFTPPHDLETENAELRARLAAARERIIAIQSDLGRIAWAEKQEAEAAVQRTVSSMAQELSIYLVHGERQGDVEFRVVQAASPESAYSAWREACFQEEIWFPNYFARKLQSANHMLITPSDALLIRRLESASPPATGAYAWCDPAPGAENHAGVARIVAYAERVS